MRKDEWQIVDGVLRDFPKINRDKVQLEEYLRSLAVSGPGSGDTIKGVGNSMFEQDRLLGVQENKRLKRLQRIVSRVYEGYRNLPNAERRLISLWCFAANDLEDTLRTLHISRRQAYRLRASAYDKLFIYCSDVHEDVKRWRATAEIEIANCLMPLLQKSREQNPLEKVGTRVT